MSTETLQRTIYCHMAGLYRVTRRLALITNGLGRLFNLAGSDCCAQPLNVCLESSRREF